MAEKLLTTTTMSVDGYRITEYKGVVRGIVVRSPTISQGFLGGLKQLIGGQIEEYAEMCEQAREQAFELLLAHARTRLGPESFVIVQGNRQSVSHRWNPSGVVLSDSFS